MKKWIAFLCSIFVLSGAMGLAACKGGCKDNGGKDSSGDDTVTTMPKPEGEAKIVFSATSTQMTVGDDYSVLYRAGEGEIVWATSNADIATVKNGVVTAMKPGEVKITASLDGDVAELSVKVVTDGLMPSLHFENGFVSGEQIRTVKGGTLNFASYVLFNTKRFEDMQVTYAVDNDALGAIDKDGKFVAKNQKGALNVSVSATWRGIESTKMSATFPVSIISDTEILFGEDNKTDVTLYTVASHGNESYATSYQGVRENLTVKSDGQDCAFVTTGADSLQNGQYTLEMTAGTEVAQWNAATDTITALRAGEAILTLTAKNMDGEIVTLTFPIEVLRPVVTVEAKVEKFSTFKGQIGGENYLTELFGGAVTLTDAYQGGDEFTGRALSVNADNTVHGLVIENFTEMKEETITVYDGNRGFAFTVEAYAQYIETASDLNSLFKNVTATIDGYFYLANDVAYDASFKPAPYAATYPENSSVFTGVFEGNGHTVEYGLVANGLFGTLGSGAVIKNASFVVKDVFNADPTIAQYSIIAKEFYGNGGVTLENVYASYDFDFTPDVRYNSWGQSTSLGLFSNANAAKVNLKNVIVDMSKVTVADPDEGTENYGFKYGAFAGRNVSNVGRWTYDNVYVLFDHPYACVERKYSSAGASNGNYVTLEEFAGVCYAENLAPESATTNPDNKDGIIEYKLVGVKQFKTYQESKAYFADNAGALAKFENFADTSLGFPVASAQQHVDYYTQVKNGAADGSELSFSVGEIGSATLSFVYDEQTINALTITHDSGVAGLVEIEGATVSYTGGGVGQEVLKVRATVAGVTVEKTITVTVQAEDLGVIYYDTDGTLPASLNGVTVGKIASAADPANVYYDGASWSLAKNTANEKVEYEAVVYDDENAAVGSAKIVAVAKVIETAADLASVYGGSSTAPITGYFLLANDITDGAPTPSDSSYFTGVFDGNGKKIEYALTANGLFGVLAGDATVKDVSLIVKGVPTTVGKSVYSVIAKKAEKAKLENIYATYDVEGFTPDVKYNWWGETSGLGLFEWVYHPTVAVNVTAKNVIVDMSKVNVGDVEAETENYTHGYGVFGVRGQTFSGSTTYWTYTNTYVIWSNKYIGIKRNTEGGSVNSAILASVAQWTLAEGDTSTLTASNGMKPSGLKRYNDYAAAVAAGVTSVGDFVITNDGVSRKAN